MTVLYRPHRGSLQDALALVRTVNDHADLVDQLRLERVGWPDAAEVTRESVDVVPYCYDPRIEWDTWLVRVNGHVAGFTNGPLEKDQDKDEEET